MKTVLIRNVVKLCTLLVSEGFPAFRTVLGNGKIQNTIN